MLIATTIAPRPLILTFVLTFVATLVAMVSGATPASAHFAGLAKTGCHREAARDDVIHCHRVDFDTLFSSPAGLQLQQQLKDRGHLVGPATPRFSREALCGLREFLGARGMLAPASGAVRQCAGVAHGRWIAVAEVCALQAALKASGVSPRDLRPDCDFGPRTLAALLNWLGQAFGEALWPPHPRNARPEEG